MKLSVIIPAFNERSTLMELLRRVLAAELPGLSRELLIVDDCSTDGTRELLREIGARGVAGVEGANPSGECELRVLFQEQNRGKGAAIRRGFAEASGEIVIVQDADLEYDPNDYAKLVKPIVDGAADVVYGSRFAGSPRRALYFWHTAVNRGLTLLSNLFTGLGLTDMETCYKAMRTECVRKLTLVEDRFGIEPELTAKLAKAGCRVFEVPISYQGRTFAEGKKIGWKDGARALYAITKYGLWAK